MTIEDIIAIAADCYIYESFRRRLMELKQTADEEARAEREYTIRDLGENDDASAQ